MTNCGIGNNGFKNMDHLICATMSNHKGSECDGKWAICCALVIQNPSESPGSTSEGSKILLNCAITEHWWWLTTHCVFGKIIMQPTNCVFLEGQHSSSSGNPIHKECAETSLKALEDSTNQEGLKCDKTIKAETIL